MAEFNFRNGMFGIIWHEIVRVPVLIIDPFMWECRYVDFS